MKPNTPEQIATGDKLIEEFGSWSAVRRNSVRTPDGHHVVIRPGLRQRILWQISGELFGK